MSKDDASNNAGFVISVAFYMPEQYPVLLELADDRAKLGETYDDWLSTYNDAVLKIRLAGAQPVKVEIDVHKLIDYCRSNGLDINSESRAKYAAILAREGGWEEIEGID